MNSSDVSHICSRNLAMDTDLMSWQWQNAAIVLTVLLITGGDVVQKALAQLSGYCVAPVAFSFGWVAYSISALMAVIGEGRLMPPPDHPAKVINAENGYTRENRSWILGRLLRDFEFPLDDHIGLHITVFKAADDVEAGKPAIDGYWATGVLVIILQLGIAALPCALHNDCGILLVTAWGLGLPLATGSLPQWSFEKWASCRKNTTKKLIVTGGNGTRHVMVIIGDGKGLDLEDLAAAETPRMRRRGECSNRMAKSERDESGAVKKDSEGKPKKKIWMICGVPASLRITQVVCLALAGAWIVFLIAVVGLKQNAWYLLAIAALGMIQNVVVAGASREIGTTGIRLNEVEKFEQSKVMDALMDVECRYKNVGKALLGEFFNGSLRPAEQNWWDGSDKKEYEDDRRKKRPSSFDQ